MYGDPPSPVHDRAFLIGGGSEAIKDGVEMVLLTFAMLVRSTISAFLRIA